MPRILMQIPVPAIANAMHWTQQDFSAVRRTLDCPVRAKKRGYLPLEETLAWLQSITRVSPEAELEMRQAANDQKEE